MMIEIESGHPAVDRYLGLLATTLGRHDDAEFHVSKVTDRDHSTNRGRSPLTMAC